MSLYGHKTPGRGSYRYVNLFGRIHKRMSIFLARVVHDCETLSTGACDVDLGEAE